MNGKENSPLLRGATQWRGGLFEEYYPPSYFIWLQSILQKRGAFNTITLTYLGDKRIISIKNRLIQEWTSLTDFCK